MDAPSSDDHAIQQNFITGETNVVHLVQTRKIRHEGRQVFLEPKDLVRLFLAG